MVLGQGLRLGVAAIAAGVVVAFFACRAVTAAAMRGGMPFDRISAFDCAAIALPLLMITILASLAPARQAYLDGGRRVDPIRALRDELGRGPLR